MKSELERMVSDIKNSTNQISINKIDEIRVMRCMLNDKDFSIGVYDKNLGCIGQRCPHEEATNFVKNIIMGSTGLDGKDSRHLAENYEFTKRDANFLLDNMRDFVTVYMGTGRKMNIIQNEVTEACIFTRPVEASVKYVPDKDNPGGSRKITTTPYVKLVSNTRCPKYSSNGNEEVVKEDEEE